MTLEWAKTFKISDICRCPFAVSFASVSHTLKLSEVSVSIFAAV